MGALDRFVYLYFHIDTNRVNARTTLDNMNQLEKWHQADVIEMDMSETAQKEAATGGNRERTRKAHSYIYTQTAATTSEEWAEIRAIEQVLFPGGARSQSEANDVDIVFNAKKYGAILVTNDGASKRQPGGILGHRDALKELGITVLTDEEAVTIVREKIEQRDRLIRERCMWEKTPLPQWVGRD